MLKKKNGEGYWNMLGDKGYDGGNKHINIITPHKGKNIPQNELKMNKKIGTARIVCENFYGRMKKLWGASREKVKGALENYDNLIDICAALTNYHIETHPLRKRDGGFLKNFSAKEYPNGNKKNNEVGSALEISNTSSQI